MFARMVSINLKPNSATEFTQLIEKETLPLLRKQKGFHDEMTFLAERGTEAVAISLWDQKEHADAYGRDSYPAVLKTLGKVVEGTPEVRTYEVSNSTAHNIRGRVAA
jgi:heme-degrading monooxygenase HmoA